MCAMGEGGRAAGGASPQGKSSEQIHCCPLLEVSWEKMETGLGTGPQKTCRISTSLGHLFHSSLQWCWAGNSVSSEAQQGREFPTSLYRPCLEFQVQIHHLLIFK